MRFVDRKRKLYTITMDQMNEIPKKRVLNGEMNFYNLEMSDVKRMYKNAYEDYFLERNFSLVLTHKHKSLLLYYNK